VVIYFKKQPKPNRQPKEEHMMSYPPSHGPDPESPGNFSDYETAEEAWRAQRRRQTYLPVVFLALVVGALIGALLSRRRRPKEPAEIAKEWLENAYAQLSEKLPQIVEKIPQLAEKIPQLAEKIPQLAEKLPHAKKASAQWCQAAFLEQANQLGKKLKWW
jgi:uncharacterized membrane-anchored protein YhcB (DUF1043 family)